MKKEFWQDVAISVNINEQGKKLIEFRKPINDVEMMFVDYYDNYSSHAEIIKQVQKAFDRTKVAYN